MTLAEAEALIAENAAADRSGTSNGRSYTTHSPAELIEFAKYLREQTVTDESAARPGLGLRFQQITPVYR